MSIFGRGTTVICKGSPARKAPFTFTKDGNWDTERTVTVTGVP